MRDQSIDPTVRTETAGAPNRAARRARLRAAFAELDRDPRLLDGIGVRDGDAGVIERYLPDLLPGLFRLMKPPGGKADIVLGHCHAGSAIYAVLKTGAEI